LNRFIATIEFVARKVDELTAQRKLVEADCQKAREILEAGLRQVEHCEREAAVGRRMAEETLIHLRQIRDAALALKDTQKHDAGDWWKDGPPADEA
jgi:hypothetical protein